MTQERIGKALMIAGAAILVLSFVVSVLGEK